MEIPQQNFGHVRPGTEDFFDTRAFASNAAGFISATVGNELSRILKALKEMKEVYEE
jgi:hypothetical protein